MSIETGNLRRGMIRGGATLACMAAIFGPLVESTAAEPTAHSGAIYQKGLADCNRFPLPSKKNNHEFEVCTALLVNTRLARRDFYQYGNNTNKIIGFLNRLIKPDSIRSDFENRYFDGPTTSDGPRTLIETVVDGWPDSDSFLGNHVASGVDLISLSSNLKADRAVARIRQFWHVDDRKGNNLYDEPSHVQNVTLCRGKLPNKPGELPTHQLHEWFIVKFTSDPKFPCIAFDKRHHIQP